jgi:hypothetical protein
MSTTDASGRPTECLALFQAELLRLTRGQTRIPVLHPRPTECGVVIPDKDQLRRFVGVVYAGKGSPKTIYRPYGGGDELWFVKLRVFTSTDLTRVLVTTLEMYEEPDGNGERVIRRFARFRALPDWEHEVMVFHFEGGWMYWLRYEGEIHEENPVMAAALLLREHASVTARPPARHPR